MSAHSDPALAALGWLLQDFAPAAGPTLFVNARPGLHAPAALEISAVQGFRPAYDALQAQHLRLLAIDPDACADGIALPAQQACVLLLPPRQREAARAEAARALLALAEDGVLIAAQANDQGAKSFEADLRQLCPVLEVHSKHKSRLLVARADHIDRAVCAAWSRLDAARPLNAAGRIQRPLATAPGLFGGERIDVGSALLIEHLPNDLAGAAADLGAGIGVLSAALLQGCPAIRSIDLFEAEARAVALARRNLADAGVPVRAHWCDVADGLHREDGAAFEARFDVVLSNPPFHIGARGEPALGQSFIRSAAAGLKPDGQLWLVANAHLPYEATLADCFGQQRRVAQAQGFKILQACSPRR